MSDSKSPIAVAFTGASGIQYGLRLVDPGFYFRPKSVSELVDFMVARVLDHLEVDHMLSERWGDEH